MVNWKEQGWPPAPTTSRWSFASAARPTSSLNRSPAGRICQQRAGEVRAHLRQVQLLSSTPKQYRTTRQQHPPPCLRGRARLEVLPRQEEAVSVRRHQPCSSCNQPDLDLLLPPLAGCCPALPAVAIAAWAAPAGSAAGWPACWPELPESLPPASAKRGRAARPPFCWPASPACPGSCAGAEAAALLPDVLRARRRPSSCAATEFPLPSASTFCAPGCQGSLSAGAAGPSTCAGGSRRARGRRRRQGSCYGVPVIST